MTGNLFFGPDRKVTCTADKTNKNGGKPYWQSPMGSCDLNQIKNKGYEVYLDNGITASQKSYQLRYPSSLDNVYNYVKTTNSAYFALRCEKSGWVMIKSSTSCQGGLPDVLPTGSQFYRSDSDIALVGGQTGKIFNSSTFTQYSGTLTKDNLSTFVATNGSKIEANCLEYFTEVDRNDKASGDAGYETGGHYYECVNGTWTIRGRCKVAVVYVSSVDSNKKSIKYFRNAETVVCSAAVFGDPHPGNPKHCRIHDSKIANEGEFFTVSYTWGTHDL